MKKQGLSFLALGLAVFSGTVLIDRFVVTLPDWLGNTLMAVVIVSMVIYFVKNRSRK